MVRTAQWSYLKDWISLGPSPSIHRKGRPRLFCPHFTFFFVVVVAVVFILPPVGEALEKKNRKEKIKKKDIKLTVCFSVLPRYLFWTEWGQNPCIGRSRLDGSDQVTLVNSGIMWPNGISLDYEVERDIRAQTARLTSPGAHPHTLYFHKPRSPLLLACYMTPLPKRVFLFAIWIFKITFSFFFFAGKHIILVRRPHR